MDVLARSARESRESMLQRVSLLEGQWECKAPATVRGQLGEGLGLVGSGPSPVFSGVR